MKLSLKNKITILFVVLMVSSFTYAESSTKEIPLTTFPYTPSLDVNSMDRSANPCEDFYQYSCGGWKKNNPIPADQSRWSVYGKLYSENQRFLWGILNNLSSKKQGLSSQQKQLGDYFAACMDENGIEKKGAQPLQKVLGLIADMKTKQDLPAVLATIHLAMDNGESFFGFSSNQNFSDSTQIIAYAAAGGLSLPNRDYYLKKDENSQDLRLKFKEHVQHMFELLGKDNTTAKQFSDTVLKMETQLAKASLSSVDKRDPYKLFHNMDGKQLQALTPHFNWQNYLKTAGIVQVNQYNVTEPEFFKDFDQLLKNYSLEDIKTYLCWHVTHAMAGYLSSKFVQEDFNYFRKTLRGVPQQKPRWKRCVSLTDEQLGESLGQEFVKRTFSPELKHATQKMTKQIEQAMQGEIKQLDWMSDVTKKKALEKLHAIVNKIGYPDCWRDYSSIVIKRNDFAGNVTRANIFESKRQLAKIGKPLDRGEWGMTPPTVNAYYNPQMNDINFPAGVLQPPLYDAKIDDAPNYGNTGGTIGHELTHAFDDEGRQFDAQGNLKDWWTKEDTQAFDKRAQCIIDQYANYTIVDDIKINSKLTLGEDIADLGGVILGWIAWQAQTANMRLKNREGLTPEQRFFVGYSQWACSNSRPEQLRINALTNPHSPGKYRVNGLMVNLPQFQKAFSCKAGQAMVKNKRCKIW
jgi:endothelin-converting enzyme/putative endopeptidase